MYKFGSDNEISFEELLAFPPFKNPFRKFCCEKYCEENIDFLDAVAKLESDTTSTVEEWESSARKIYDDFIKPNSKFELNVDGAFTFPVSDVFLNKKPVRREIFNQIKGWVSCVLLRSPIIFVDNILKLLEYNILPNFFKSHAMKEIYSIIQRRNESRLKTVLRSICWVVFVAIHSLALVGNYFFV